MDCTEDWFYLIRPGTNIRYLNSDKNPLAIHIESVDDELKRCECRTGGKWGVMAIPEYQCLFGVI